MHILYLRTTKYLEFYFSFHLYIIRSRNLWRWYVHKAKYSNFVVLLRFLCIYSQCGNTLSYSCVGPVCPRLIAPVNGAVQLSGVTPGATATYSCNPGYRLTGPETRTCQVNVTWSDTAPVCQPNRTSQVEHAATTILLNYYCFNS